MMSNSYESGGAALFSGGGFMPSQATQTPESSFSKSRASQVLLPLTVKQISEAYHSNDDKSNFAVDGIEVTNVRLLGIVTNKLERVTDVSFSLDDGTGRIDIIRWVNETSDTNEMAVIENGMYVIVNGSLKGFQDKKRIVAFSVRPVDDYNEVTHHFLECIHVHIENTRKKASGGSSTALQQNNDVQTPVRNDVKSYQTPATNYQTPATNQFSSHTSTSGSGGDILKMVLDVFQEPSSLAPEHGLHVDEVVRRLGLPAHKIKEAIEYHVEVGNIYSTIDDFHYRSAMNG